MNIYKNFSFFPALLSAAAAKFGAGNYILRRRDADGRDTFLSPERPAPAVDQQLIDGGWFHEPVHVAKGDVFVSEDGGEAWGAVANPGWPLAIERDGRHYLLLDVHDDAREGLGRYRTQDQRHILHARLTDSGLDVWDPRVLAEAPFPAILGRNYIEDGDLSAALADKGVEVKETELGWVKGGILSRLEYTWQGQLRVAYEVTGRGGPDSFLSTSVVMAEPKPVDERDLHWVARMVKEAPDPRKKQ